jgi:ribosomal protein L37E
MRCKRCGEAVIRVRRKKWERLLYASVYQCPKCHRKAKIPRYPSLYLVSLHRSCPRCGTPHLEKLRKRDKIDPLYRNPVSLLQGVLGARLWWCPFCRVQFYDCRPGWPVARASSVPRK